jgi:hypothetical protein
MIVCVRLYVGDSIEDFIWWCVYAFHCQHVYIGGQDSAFGKLVKHRTYGPKGTYFDPRLDRKRRSA